MKTPTKKHHPKKPVERIKTYSVEFIFDFISKNPDEPYYIDENGNRCKLRRAKIYFEKGLICAEDSCSLKGAFFALERWPNQKDQSWNRQSGQIPQPEHQTPRDKRFDLIVP